MSRADRLDLSTWLSGPDEALRLRGVGFGGRLYWSRTSMQCSYGLSPPHIFLLRLQEAQATSTLLGLGVELVPSASGRRCCSCCCFGISVAIFRVKS